MASIRTQENIATLTRLTGTTASLAASVFNIGGQQFRTTQPLVLNTAILGAGGVDVALVATKLYWVFAVISGGAPALFASSTSNILPTGFTQARLVGCFYTNSSSQILWAAPKPQPIEVTLTAASGTYTPSVGCTGFRLRMVGPGGGGAGSASTGWGPQGSVSTATTFSNFLTAGPGGAQIAFGGIGGAVTLGTLPTGWILNYYTNGQNGGTGQTKPSGDYTSGFGGSNLLGLGGASNVGLSNGLPGNGFGAGGGGASLAIATAGNTGPGGGSGAYIDAQCSLPAGPYSYACGPSASGGAPGANGMTGGPSSQGAIVIDEFFT